MSSSTRLVWDAMGAQRRRLTLAAFVGVLASTSVVALLGVSAWLIARAAEMPPVLTLTVAAVMVRAFALGRAVFRYAERIIGHDAAFRGLASLRVAVYDGMERITPLGMTRYARGDLLSRLVTDVDAALDLPLRVVLPWVQATVVTAGTVAVLTIMLPGSGLLTGVTAVLALVLVPALAAALAARFERAIAPARSALASTIVTSLTAVADLTALGRVTSVRARIAEQDADVTAAVRRESTSIGMAAGLMTALLGIAVIGAVLTGTPAVRDGRLAPVMLAVVALLPLALFDVLSTLPGAALALQRLRGSTDRIAEIITAPQIVPDPSEPSALPAAGALHIRGLHAGWTGVDVLHDIDLDISFGDRLAVVGPSGAGKSTLAAVLMRFIDYRGSVTIGGVELKACIGDDVRAHIGMLDQAPHLFDTSIAENIRLGRPGIDDDHIRAAIDVVELGDWVRSLPRGIDEPVGQFGTAVSGGQAQRIAVARLLVEPRPLLVVDEPTEHLDVVTTASVQRALDELARGRTLITITHRLSGLRDTDAVVVVDDGRVVERGTAAELAGSNGWFAEQLKQERADEAMLGWLAAIPEGVGVPRPLGG